MPASLIITNSGIPNIIPTPGMLAFGELALNWADSALYFKDTEGDIRVIPAVNESDPEKAPLVTPSFTGPVTVTSTNGMGVIISSNINVGAYVTSNSGYGASISSTSGYGASISSDTSVGAYLSSISGVAAEIHSGTGAGAHISSSTARGAGIFSDTNTGAEISSSEGDYHATFGTSGIDRSFIARLKGAFGWIRGAFTGRIHPPDTLTGNRTWTLPNATGTIALTSDINPVVLAAALGIPTYADMTTANLALEIGKPFYNTALTKLDITTA